MNFPYEDYLEERVKFTYVGVCGDYHIEGKLMGYCYYVGEGFKLIVQHDDMSADYYENFDDLVCIDKIPEIAKIPDKL